ncbi:MAG: hypothetical protein WCK39_07815 [Methanomassiliicoccales archaeon]
MKHRGDLRRAAPKGFLPTDEMRRIIASNRELVLVAHAYDCTGEEVDSVAEAHTVVVMIFDGEMVVYEEQVEGSPCMIPAKQQR